MNAVEYLVLSQVLYLNPNGMVQLMRSRLSFSYLWETAVKMRNAVWQDYDGNTYQTKEWPQCVNLETGELFQASSFELARSPDIDDLMRGVNEEKLNAQLQKAKTFLMFNALSEFVSLHNGATLILNPILVDATIERLRRE